MNLCLFVKRFINETDDFLVDYAKDMLQLLRTYIKARSTSHEVSDASKNFAFTKIQFKQLVDYCVVVMRKGFKISSVTCLTKRQTALRSAANFVIYTFSEEKKRELDVCWQ